MSALDAGTARWPDRGKDEWAGLAAFHNAKSRYARALVAVTADLQVPAALDRPHRRAQQGVGAAPPDLPADLLEQRPGRRVAHDEHLPVRLDVDAAFDEQGGQAFDAGVDHGGRSLRA